MLALSPPRHGGDLLRAMADYGGERADWLDCSSGIAPDSYPLPPVPASIWQRLPEQDAALLAAARDYYGCDTLLAVPGSQAAIALLPQLRAPCRVGVLSPSYAEHAWQWQQQSHPLRLLAAEQIEAALPELDVLVVVNPNNPTGALIDTARLRDWHGLLAARGGWLVVDEAFADAAPTHSLLAMPLPEGLIVLRSLGKFFGLAGVRLGFVAAAPALLDALALRLGPWSVSAPAQWAGEIALRDRAWQTAQRYRLAQASQKLSSLLNEVGLVVAGRQALLHWCPHPQAALWHAALAQQRLWCRYFAAPAGLRFGLPQPEQFDLFAARLKAAAHTLNKDAR